MEYQVARVNYHFRRLSEIRRGIPSESGGNVEFEAFVFFEVCYHLKDWIASDPRYLVHDHDVHLFIKNSRPLRICHDLCNRQKHRDLSNPKAGTLSPFRVQVTQTVGPAGVFGTLDSISLVTDLGEECAFSLADNCMTEWNSYFALHPELLNESRIKLCTPAGNA